MKKTGCSNKHEVDNKRDLISKRKTIMNKVKDTPYLQEKYL